ncbi:MAG: DUF1800 domain-containing protein, partial [Candidatus Dormibacteraeota bacterium]|nr:DUF1800 domain-containing protein [Candidatus Dormibacteraeota bacterium]
MADVTTGAGPGIRRRSLLGAAGVAGLGGAIGLGFWLRERATGSMTTDRQKATHLLRRAGFAPSPAEVDAAMHAGLAATTDSLLHPQSVDDGKLEASLASTKLDLTNVTQLRQWWLTRMVETRRPLQEKMTLFWHGILTSSYRKQGQARDLVHVQNDLLRANALGNLRDMLIGITKDGMMLRWLDGTGSSKAHPNENYARELMELFTMGAGNYTESDVREGARALTGWAVGQDGSVRFNARALDDGAKTFLGKTGNLGVDEVVDAILAQPATPKYIARRMWEFFAYGGPSDGDIQPIVDAYNQTHGDIRAMMGALLTSPAFFSDKAHRALVKSPAELVAGLNRQLGLPVSRAQAGAGEGMGQALFDPPCVAGWPGGAAWLSTGSWMARVRYLLTVSGDAQAALARAAADAGAKTPEAAVGHLADVMLEGSLTAGARQAVVDHAGAIVKDLGGGPLSPQAVA